MTTAELSEWNSVKQRLRDQLGAKVFDGWFSNLEFEAKDAGIVSLSVPTRFLKNWLQSRYQDLLLDLCSREFEGVHQVDVVIRSAVHADLRTRQDLNRESPANINLLKFGSGQTPIILNEPNKTSFPSKSTGILIGSPLDARHTFSNFVEGKSNCVALAASKCVASGTNLQSVGFDLLFVHASVGLGKTHLLQSIAGETVANGRKTAYFTAEHFMFSFISSLRNKTALSFKEEIRSADILLVDDLQFLQGPQVQREFGHTLNYLLDGTRQVVVTADRPFVELESIGERVRSRLAGGCLVEITGPDLDLRRRTLQKIAEERLSRLNDNKRDSYELPEAVIDFIANNVSSSVRDLDGAVTRVITHAQFSNTPITLSLAENLLRDFTRTRDSKQIKIEDIQRIVCDTYKISKSEIISHRRIKSLVRARQIAMYLAKVLTYKSLPEIGKCFGNRNHTTVLHAIRKTEKVVSEDSKAAAEVNAIRRHLELNGSTD